MPWSAIDETEVLEEFAATGELASLQAVAGGNDNLPTILARVVNEVRGYCIASANPVGPQGSIPDQLRPSAIAIAKWRWLIAFPKFAALQTEERKSAYADALALLKEIGSGDPHRPKVELPADSTALDVAAPNNSVEVVNPKRRLFTTGTNSAGQIGRLDRLF